ncbi:MAG TPA: asparagine synthase (glutamine-hydrolyzing) [Chitinophagaceae bacterium]|nr:asparagine synthase (glutamine-hydrolyzing) [Chitinophagaceae bacterium]
MCGIAGIWYLSKKPLAKEKLIRFTDSLSHRGPDDGSYWIDRCGFLGLGHRKLSILDPSPLGNQPMPYANDRYRIVYNGEVFNFLELKRELEIKNYQFRTNTDTEVILAAYDCWGKDCLNKFNGMWAFAIWDELQQSLFLARDRFGIKPLYYTYKSHDTFAFASETYAFKFLDGFNREFNKKHLAINIADSFSLEGHGHTIYKNIFQVLPGHYLEINAKTIGIQQNRWWSTLSSTTEFSDNYFEQVEYFRELFFDAIKLRTPKVIPFASALSGGLDSSSIYCGIYHIMNNATAHGTMPDNWQKAFVATFPGTSIDERCYAEQVIEFTKGEVEYTVPDLTKLAQKIKDTTVLFDNIYLTPMLPICEIYSAMKRMKIKISMDGHGVDEMLFGYPSMMESIIQLKYNGSLHKHNDILETMLNMNSSHDRDLIRKRLTNNSYSGILSGIKSIAKKVLPDVVKQFLTKYRIAGNEFGINLNGRPYSLTNEPYNIENLSLEQRIPFQTFHITLLPTILRNFDRASMQSGIEIRMPFMDYRLVSFIFSIPFTSKVGDGHVKRIVKDAMKGIIPEAIRTRKWKVGFNAPMEEWFSGELKEFILDEINSSVFMHADVWNGNAVRQFAEKRIKEKSWTHDDCITFWPVLNAHLLISNNNQS